jgi:Carbohydrate binding domain (family 11)
MNDRIAKLLCTVFLFIVGTWLFGGCSNNVAGTGGTDYPNTKNVAGIVNNSSGLPVQGARVLLVENAGWLGDILAGKKVVLDSAVTDAAGKFIVPRPSVESWNMQIDSREEGLLATDFGDDLDTTAGLVHVFSLRPYAVIAGTLHPDAQTPLDLLFAGSAYRGVVNADNTYSVCAIAQGEYAVILETSVGGTVQKTLGTALRVDAGATDNGVDMPAPINRVCVDDFSIGQSRTNLGRLIGGGMWFTANDSAYGGNSSNSYSLVSGAGAFSGSSMLAVYHLGSQIPGPWAIVGLYLGRTAPLDVFDFSDLQALSFWAKGSGKIEVRLYSQILDTLAGNNMFQFSYVMTIPSTWTHVTIPVDSLGIPQSSVAFQAGYTWKQAAKAIEAIDFVAKYPDNNPGDSVTLWLDDISLDGMSLGTFVR